MNHQRFLAVFCFTAVLLTACQKEDSKDSTAGSCKVTKQYLFDNGVKNDSLEFTYSGRNVVKSVDKPNNEYATYEYNSSNRIIKVNYFEGLATTRPYSYANISYNTDGTLAKVEYWDNGLTPAAIVYNTIFTYSAGKLTKETSSTINNGTAIKETEIVYTHTGNNVTKAVITDFSVQPAESETLNYTFDTNENYFKKDGLNRALVGGFGGDFGLPAVPLVTNANNVTSFTYGNFPVPLAYTLDAQKNLTLISAAGQPLFGFAYQCP